jgi:hypothetical protein
VENIMFENEQFNSRKSTYETDLREFKNINNSLMQDALKVWSDLWAELDSSRKQMLQPNGQVEPFKIAKPEVDTGFEPSCGCSEFVKKMWVLRSYIDFAKRISR